MFSLMAPKNSFQRSCSGEGRLRRCSFSNSTEINFGAPAGPYQVFVFFPNNPDPVVFEGVEAGTQITVVEP